MLNDFVYFELILWKVVSKRCSHQCGKFRLFSFTTLVIILHFIFKVGSFTFFLSIQNVFIWWIFLFSLFLLIFYTLGKIKFAVQVALLFLLSFTSSKSFTFPQKSYLKLSKKFVNEKKNQTLFFSYSGLQFTCRNRSEWKATRKLLYILSKC